MGKITKKNIWMLFELIILDIFTMGQQTYVAHHYGPSWIGHQGPAEAPTTGPLPGPRNCYLNYKKKHQPEKFKAIWV
jgi:hypothetical protein